MSPNPSHLAEDLAAVETFTAHLWDEVSRTAVSSPSEVHWQRDGLSAVAARLEDLKTYDAVLEALWADLQRIKARCNRWIRWLGDHSDDTLREGLQSSVTSMVSRGLAWEERRIAHQTKVVEILTWRRRFELATEDLRAAEDTLRVRMERVRSERFALQAQTRLINLGLEIGEL